MTDPAELYEQLTTAFNQRSWRRALDLAARLEPLGPPHAGVYYIAGIAHLELQQMSPALEYLRRATILEPSRAEFAAHYAKALALTRQNRDAKVVADRALTLSQADPLTLDTLGVIFTQVGDYAGAVNVFRRAATLAPKEASYRYNLATSLIAAGNLDGAEVALECCISLDPQYWRAHLTLSQLKRQTPNNNHVGRLESLLLKIQPNAPNTAALVCINMALAKEYEDIADYAEAFKHLVSGKSAGGANRNYSIRQDEALFEAIIEACHIPTSPTKGYQSSEPIFIIGMPRTGTTLVERIISNHPDVYSAGELLNFGMSLKQASGSVTPALIDPDVVHLARNIDWKQLGETYISSTRPATGQKLRFIDKLPHNFLYAGFIANALPYAKIICLRRDPMDTCLSNFRQLFAPKSPYFDYSFDLLDIGRYYVLFDRLMSHWRRVFPGRILEIEYETLVDAQEVSSRQLVAFCGLPWNDNCLRFENNPTPVATASAVQVRAPIYRSALKRWKKYAPQLGSLHKLLSEAGITIE